jgi:hypothetical protein
VRSLRCSPRSSAGRSGTTGRGQRRPGQLGLSDALVASLSRGPMSTTRWCSETGIQRRPGSEPRREAAWSGGPTAVGCVRVGGDARRRDVPIRPLGREQGSGGRLPGLEESSGSSPDASVDDLRCRIEVSLAESPGRGRRWKFAPGSRAAWRNSLLVREALGRSPATSGAPPERKRRRQLPAPPLPPRPPHPQAGSLPAPGAVPTLERDLDVPMARRRVLLDRGAWRWRRSSASASERTPRRRGPRSRRR